MIWIWPIVGALVGWLNALLLSVAVKRLDAAQPEASFMRMSVSMAGRWLVVAAVLAAAFKCGIKAGLLALTGFWVARWAAILWWQCKG